MGRKMKIIKNFFECSEFIGDEIKKGKLVAFPTDTVYGLGAEVSNDIAIKKIYDIKNRPYESPLIVLIGDKSFLQKLVYIEDDKVELLIDKFWPGALTLVFKKKEWVSNMITAGGDTLGVRMPDNEIARKLIIDSGGALAVPSANKSGQLSPVSVGHVIRQFDEEEIDFVIDGGKTSKAIESTILDMTREIPLILRNGAVSKEEIEKIIGQVEEIENKKKAENKFSKEIIIKERADLIKMDKKELILFFKPLEDLSFNNSEYLSEQGDYKEASRNLFEALYKLLDKPGDKIYVEKLEEEGFGKVIMERIKKIAK
jgi:L-threonylcarbamoyladenylate synthase